MKQQETAIQPWECFAGESNPHSSFLYRFFWFYPSLTNTVGVGFLLNDVALTLVKYYLILFFVVAADMLRSCEATLYAASEEIEVVLLFDTDKEPLESYQILKVAILGPDQGNPCNLLHDDFFKLDECKIVGNETNGRRNCRLALPQACLQDQPGSKIEGKYTQYNIIEKIMGSIGARDNIQAGKSHQMGGYLRIHPSTGATACIAPIKVVQGKLQALSSRAVFEPCCYDNIIFKYCCTHFIRPLYSMHDVTDKP